MKEKPTLVLLDGKQKILSTQQGNAIITLNINADGKIEVSAVGELSQKLIDYVASISSEAILTLKEKL